VRCCKRGPTGDDSTELSVTPPTDYQQFNSTPSAVPVRTQVKVVLNSPKSLVRAEIPPHAHMTTVNSSSPSGPQVISPRRQPSQMDSTPINSRCDPPEFSASLDISADLDFPNGVERRLSAISISSGVSDTSDDICSGRNAYQSGEFSCDSLMRPRGFGYGSVAEKPIVISCRGKNEIRSHNLLFVLLPSPILGKIGKSPANPAKRPGSWLGVKLVGIPLMSHF